ncbi:MAG TPA: hypothetical protein VH415_09245 [Nitrososphaeraceae archaeon]
MTGLLLLFTFLAYSHASAQTGSTGQLIIKSNITILNDPLRNAILTFSDGTSILDLDGTSDLPSDTTVTTTSDASDSSDQATATTTSDASDSSDQATTSDLNLSRTTSLDSNNRATTGEVGSTTGEVGSTTGEVGTSTGEIHSPTGEVGW